jgi:anaerobic ribonucleoside-triphosphate reductase activating protein
MYYIETSMYSDGINFPSVSIYFKGCDKEEKCKNCHNPQLWEFDDEMDLFTDIIQKIEKQLLTMISYYDIISICFIGGEPTSKRHIFNLSQISKYFKDKYKSRIRNILYSWRYFEDLNLNYLKYIDYGVLGEYDENLKTNSFPGSSNQYIYDFNNNKKIKKEEVI